MYLTSEIVKDTQAARRFRLLAPLAIVLTVAVLILAQASSGTEVKPPFRQFIQGEQPYYILHWIGLVPTCGSFSSV